MTKRTTLQEMKINTLKEDARPILPDPTAVSQGEFAKSGKTRTRILEAAIECLATNGYAATSTTTVAKTAGLTRAAMLYHFPNRMALIEAIVYYVTQRRVEMQEEVQRSIPRDEKFHYYSLDSMWTQLQTPEFFAFSELAVAARTDPELEAIFRPAMESFDLARREMANKLAAENVKNSPGFDLRRDITRFALEGLAQQNGITFDKQKRMAEITWFLKLLFEEAYSGRIVEKAQEMAAKELDNK